MVTDGWQNRGDAERAISAIVNAEIRLDIFTPPGARSIPNVAMTALSLPPALEKAAPFELGVTMENLNDAPVTGTIAIARDGALIDQRKVTLRARLAALRLPGAHRNRRPRFVRRVVQARQSRARRVPRGRLAQGMGRSRHAAQSSDSHRQREGRELSRHRRQSDGARTDRRAGYRRGVGRNRRGLRRGADQQRAERAYRAGRAERDDCVRESRRFARDDRRRFEFRSWRLRGQSARGGDAGDDEAAAAQGKEARAGFDYRQVGIDGPQRKTHLRQGRGRDRHEKSQGQRPDRRHRIRLAAVRRHPAAVGRAEPRDISIR